MKHEQVVSGFLHSIILGFTFIFCSNVGFADSADLVTCPSVNTFKVSHFEMTVPYGYDSHDKTMKVLVIAQYTSDTHQVFDLLINPVRVESGDTLVNNVNSLIGQLQSEAGIPLTYHINDEDGSVSVCAYSLPGDAGVTALLVAEDSDIGSDQDFASEQVHRAHKRQFFVNQLILR